MSYDDDDVTMTSTRTTHTKNCNHNDGERTIHGEGDDDDGHHCLHSKKRKFLASLIFRVLVATKFSAYLFCVLISPLETE